MAYMNGNEDGTNDRAEQRRRDDEEFARLVTDPATTWCRARLLHALANAARQGVLDEVIGELIVLGSDADETLEKLLEGLVDSGWLKSPDERLVP